ncbi:MAG TPA: hypothetical protein VNP04_15665 [Alphaproteobacteria bacterium]|nr:hypothetical protein [Alphaproteobacteria bacterium]
MTRRKPVRFGYYHCRRGDIPTDRAHAFLSRGMETGCYVNEAEQAAIAASWHAHLQRHGVPHVCEWDADGQIRQIYTVRRYGPPCCRRHATDRPQERRSCRQTTQPIGGSTIVAGRARQVAKRAISGGGDDASMSIV